MGKLNLIRTSHLPLIPNQTQVSPKTKVGPNLLRSYIATGSSRGQGLDMVALIDQALMLSYGQIKFVGEYRDW